jgi:signal transduction histidine kinase
MREGKEEERRPPAAGTSAFHDLEVHAKRLERSIFVLVAFVAVAPPLLFAIVGLRDLHRRAETHAGHVGKILELYRAMPQASEEGLDRHLRVEFEHDALAGIEVTDVDGRERLRLGNSPSRFPFPHAAELRLGAGAAPFARVRVRLDDDRLRHDVLRLVAVHLLVGLALGLGVYRVPVRALGRAIRELEKAQAQLVHSNRLSAVGAIYAGLTHEINNPLGILCARAQLLLARARESGLDPESVHDLEVIERQGGRIAAIVRGLLAFARKEEPSRQPVDLNAVVQDVVSLVGKPLAIQRVELRQELQPSLPALRGNPEQLAQVLLNLVNNARDAMPGGGTLTVRTFARNSHVVAQVRDSGPGLSAEVQRRLFEPFFTTKEVGRGTGLGLSVSFGIARAHGGDLSGANGPTGGAQFELSLPAAVETRA